VLKAVSAVKRDEITVDRPVAYIVYRRTSNCIIRIHSLKLLEADRSGRAV
jgi:hypothetical protein